MRLNLGATPVYGNQLGPAVNLCQTGYALAGAQVMSFIERYLGFSPDQGDRPFEVLFLVVLVGIISVLAWRFFHKLSDKN
jgi:hypothetical protein